MAIAKIEQVTTIHQEDIHENRIRVPQKAKTIQEDHQASRKKEEKRAETPIRNHKIDRSKTKQERDYERYCMSVIKACARVHAPDFCAMGFCIQRWGCDFKRKN